MSRLSIRFSGHTALLKPINRPALKQNMMELARKAGKEIQLLHFIFADDQALLEINRKFLNHDYYTDIITFDLSEEPNALEAEIHISHERVKENAIQAGELTEHETLRVMHHGLLHLLGYKDKNKKDQEEMRKMENACIAAYEELKSFHVKHAVR